MPSSSTYILFFLLSPTKVKVLLLDLRVLGPNFIA
ncbi:hypothetical protein SLEP1_g23533 [Rubroshorea leprosula]|uniref:Uncharacterized protein n=1 Tax=Rubroshorea leprosula TaxID=152421 RepID=A0AAV5JCP7_9ROSI|nr:hypothetical protein SLEP1_g23533 [Rubroshorea leprosula]